MRLSLAATVTEMNGAYSLRPYDNGFYILNNGTMDAGYGVRVVRGDQNYNDSRGYYSDDLLTIYRERAGKRGRMIYPLEAVPGAGSRNRAVFNHKSHDVSRCFRPPVSNSRRSGRLKSSQKGDIVSLIKHP